MTNDRRIVWASGVGRITYCRHCGEPVSECVCRATPTTPIATSVPRDGYLRVGRSSKGRGGKTVTTITGAPGSLDELRQLAQTLKKVCGSGGTVRQDGVIEVQGDVRERVAHKLVELGFKVKRVGG